MNRLIIFIFLISFCFSCQKKLPEEIAFLPDMDYQVETTAKTTLSNLLGNYRIIQLQTTDSCLIDKNSKVIKYQDTFYIYSKNEILIFDNNGVFIGKLARFGKSPEDYDSLHDFDIETVDNSTEIWIATGKQLKRYDARTFQYKGVAVNCQYPIQQFHRYHSGDICVKTAGDDAFILYDGFGKTIQSFLKKDLANSGQKITQFFQYKDEVMYQIDATNTGVVYDPFQRELITKPILGNLPSNYLTMEKNKKYYEQYGYMEQALHIRKDFVLLYTFKYANDHLLMITLHKDKNRITVQDENKSTQNYFYYPEAPHLKNDILPTESMRFLTSVGSCQSDNSILFIVPISELTTFENIRKSNLSEETLSPINKEDNMLLLEIYTK